MTDFLNLCAHMSNCGAPNVTNNKTTQEINACSVETHSARQIVATINPAVSIILSLLLAIGARLRSIGSCPNTSKESRINAKTEESLCSREERTIEADRAALMDKTEVNLYPFNLA